MSNNHFWRLKNRSKVFSFKICLKLSLRAKRQPIYSTEVSPSLITCAVDQNSTVPSLYVILSPNPEIKILWERGVLSNNLFNPLSIKSPKCIYREVPRAYSKTLSFHNLPTVSVPHHGLQQQFPPTIYLS